MQSLLESIPNLLQHSLKNSFEFNLFAKFFQFSDFSDNSLKAKLEEFNSLLFPWNLKKSPSLVKCSTSCISFWQFSSLIKFFIIKFNKDKALESITNCSFDKLKRIEEINGFAESVFGQKTGKKIRFFNLGKDNNWRKNLPKDILRKMNNIFSEDLEKLNYSIS